MVLTAKRANTQMITDRSILKERGVSFSVLAPYQQIHADV